MALIKKKISARRKQVRESISAERYERISHVLTGSTILSSLILLLFIGVSTVILSIDASDKMIRWKSNAEIFSIAAIVVLVCLAAAATTGPSADRTPSKWVWSCR